MYYHIISYHIISYHIISYHIISYHIISYLTEEDFIADFKTLPLSSVYGMSDPEDKLHIMNSLFKECIGRHVPLKRIKITRPPAPWLKDPDIVKAKAERDLLQKNAPKKRMMMNCKSFVTSGTD